MFVFTQHTLKFFILLIAQQFANARHDFYGYVYGAKSVKSMKNKSLVIVTYGIGAKQAFPQQTSFASFTLS